MRASVAFGLGVAATLVAAGLTVGLFAPGLLAATLNGPSGGATPRALPTSVTAAAVEFELPSVQANVSQPIDAKTPDALNAREIADALDKVKKGVTYGPAAFWRAIGNVLGGAGAAAWLASTGADRKKVRGTHQKTMNKMWFTGVTKENDRWGDKRKGIFLKVVDYVAEAGVPGDYVETGVFNGASAVIVAERMLKNQLVPPKKLWLYDSWKGMPETIEEDGARAAKTVGWGKWATPEHVAKELTKIGLDIPSSTVFREGWFNTTFTLPKPDQVAFLHIDSDWYDSVLSSLEAFYDLIPDGGVVLFDDFGMWEGCRQAVYVFCERRGIAPLLERNARAQAYWVKGKEHNRDSTFMP